MKRYSHLCLVLFIKIPSFLFLIPPQNSFDLQQDFHFVSNYVFLKIIFLVFLIQPQYVFEEWQAFSASSPTINYLNRFTSYSLIQLQYLFEEWQDFSLRLQLLIILTVSLVLTDSAPIFFWRVTTFFTKSPSHLLYHKHPFICIPNWETICSLKSDKLFHFVSNYIIIFNRFTSIPESATICIWRMKSVFTKSPSLLGIVHKHPFFSILDSASISSLICNKLFHFVANY